MLARVWQWIACRTGWHGGCAGVGVSRATFFCPHCGKFWSEDLAELFPERTKR